MKNKLGQNYTTGHTMKKEMLRYMYSASTVLTLDGLYPNSLIVDHFKNEIIRSIGNIK